MRNLLALLAAILLAFAGTGFYRSWYRVESLPSEPGQTAFRIDINRTKILADVGEAAGRVLRVLTREQEKPASDAAATP